MKATGATPMTLGTCVCEGGRHQRNRETVVGRGGDRVEEVVSINSRHLAVTELTTQRLRKTVSSGRDLDQVIINFLQLGQ